MPADEPSRRRKVPRPAPPPQRSLNHQRRSARAVHVRQTDADAAADPAAPLERFFWGAIDLKLNQKCYSQVQEALNSCEPD